MRTRPLLPHALSVGSLCLILLLLGLSQRKVFWSGIVFCLVGMFALRVYKRMRLIPMAWFVFLFVAILTGAWIGPEYFSWLLEQKQNLEARMQVSILDALSIASKHRWLGMGIGQGTQEWGIWSQIVAEHGAMGIFLYGGFFAGLLWELYRIGREPRVVVSNVALLSVALFLLFVSHYYTNAYSPGIWVWYSIWSLLAASQFKKENV